MTTTVYDVKCEILFRDGPIQAIVWFLYKSDPSRRTTHDEAAVLGKDTKRKMSPSRASLPVVYPCLRVCVCVFVVFVLFLIIVILLHLFVGTTLLLVLIAALQVLGADVLPLALGYVSSCSRGVLIQKGPRLTPRLMLSQILFMPVS